MKEKSISGLFCGGKVWVLNSIDEVYSLIFHVVKIIFQKKGDEHDI